MSAITSAVLAVGAMAYKGFSALDAAKTQSRMAGRLGEQAEDLEKQALADIEQNNLEAVQAPMQIFDTANEYQTVDGSTILEAAKEGDQRGVAATAGKIKATQDAARTESRDAIAKVQTDIAIATAKEGNRKGELVGDLKDERAIELQLEADVLEKNAQTLEAQGTTDLASAGVAAFSALTPAFSSKAGKAAKVLMEANPGLSKTDALAQAEAGLKAAEAANPGGDSLIGATQDKIKGALDGVSNFTGIGDGKDFSESGFSTFTGIGDGKAFDQSVIGSFVGGIDWSKFNFWSKKK